MVEERTIVAKIISFINNLLEFKVKKYAQIKKYDLIVCIKNIYLI